MATQKKIQMVEEYSKKFKEAKSIFLADFSGINVSNINDFRVLCRNAGVEYRVIKNTLAKRSLGTVGIDGLNDMLKGVTAFAYSANDAIAPVKVIKEYNKVLSKSKKSLKLKGCVFEGKIFGPEKVEQLADLPTREELLCQFSGLLQSPLSNLSGTLKATGQKLMAVLSSVKQSKTS